MQLLLFIYTFWNILLTVSWHACTPLLKKKPQKGGPGIFWFDEERADEFFHVY